MTKNTISIEFIIAGRNVAPPLLDFTGGGATKTRNGDNAMAFVPVPNGVRVALEFSLHGQLCVNVYWVGKSSPIVSADLTAIAEIFKDWWINDTSDFLSEDLSLDRIIATDYSEANGESIVYTTDLPEIGGLVAGSSPNQVCLVVSRLSGFSGRSNRGRVYIPGIAVASITDNEVNGTVQGGLVAAHTALNSLLAGDSYFSLTVSTIGNGNQRPNALIHGVTAWAANNRVDTQRRRLPGEGT